MSDHESPAIVHCPLCNGPLHLEGSHLVCAVGHETSHEEAAHHTELRLSEALHMAIEALGSEATMLRLLSGSPDAERHAADAESQGELLRQFARRYADGDSDGLPW